MIYFYRSQPIFSFPVDWSERPVARYLYELPVRQIGFGDAKLEPEQNHLAQGFELSVDLSGLAGIQSLEAFVQRVRGRLRGFWLPGPNWEMTRPARVVLPTRIDDHKFDVPEAGLFGTWDIHPCRHLWLTDTENEAAAVRMVAVTQPAPGIERIETEEALPAAFDETWAVARLHFVRFDGDALDVQCDSPQFATARPRCYELPLEYAAAQLGDRPVWLYEFREAAVAGTLQTWRYTSHDVLVNAVGEDWTPAPFAHGPLVETVRGEQTELELESFTFEGSPLLLFFPFAPQRRLYFTLRELRLDDEMVTVRFEGEVRRAEAEGRLIHARVATRLDAESRQLPRLMISRTCSYQLGDSGCTVDLANFSNTGTITIIDGAQITFPAGAGRPLNWFADGHCIVTGGPTGREVRQIMASNGAILQLNAPFAGAIVGDSLTAYAGCNKRYASGNGCAKFSNQINFGGHPFIDRNLALKAIDVKQTQPSGKK